MASISSEGAGRIATTALWSHGGFEVQLRMPGLANSDSIGEQLGLVSPEFQDVVLGPAVWRKSGSCRELLVDGSAVAMLVGAGSLAATQSFFQSAVGVLVQGVLYSVTGCEPLPIAGTVQAYCLHLQEPTWE